jgi:hypothetical protein
VWCCTWRCSTGAVQGLIGLQSGAHVAPYYNLEWLHRPDVHGGEVCAGIVSGLIGPHAKEVDRWETLWHYMQSGPGVFRAISTSTRPKAICARWRAASTRRNARSIC